MPHQRNEGGESTTLTTDAEKAFDKVQHLFMIKTLRKLGNYLNIIKAMWKALSKHHTQWWQNESFSSKIRNKTRMFSSTTFTQHSAESSGQSIWTRKRNEGIQTRKEGEKLSLFSEDIILYVGNTKDCTKRPTKTNE